jgi:hypothetical protein
MLHKKGALEGTEQHVKRDSVCYRNTRNCAFQKEEMKAVKKSTVLPHKSTSETKRGGEP